MQHQAEPTSGGDRCRRRAAASEVLKVTASLHPAPVNVERVEAPSGWWGRAMRFGLDRSDTRWSSHLGPRMAEEFVGVPVRAWIVDGRLRHPRGGFLDRESLHSIVGWVTSATADRTACYVAIHVEVPAIRRALALAERDHRLTDIGLSLSAAVEREPQNELGRSVEVVTRVVWIQALDFVSSPACDGACLLRSVSQEETSKK
jgi:hypothetical protein